MIKESIENAINEQIKKEEYSSRLYLQMASWCEVNGFKGAARTSNNYRSPITLEVVERIVRKEMDEYQETENIKFFYGS